MNDTQKCETLIKSWVKLSAMVKNSRITKGLVYNEAIIMLLIYERYQKDGEGVISIKEITKETNMLKSLVNRTINSLEQKGFIERCEKSGDKRMVYVKCIADRLETFLIIHKGSIDIATQIIDIIGDEDTNAFIRIVNKLEKAGYNL
ncbi:MAG: MarR family transcriptional regulator [Clostridia bacterium]|nr:MarR family transcriptional regulator [Clostridia bacterium]